MRTAIFFVLSLAAMGLVLASIAACFTGVATLPGLLGAYFGTRLFVAASAGVFNGVSDKGDDYVF